MISDLKKTFKELELRDKEAVIEKLSDCCSVSALEKIDSIYQSNSDEFTLYSCAKCKQYWLYHKHEDNWMDNHRFDWDEYQEWYIGIHEADLPKVCEIKFSEITQLHGLVYNDTTHHYPDRDWRMFWGEKHSGE